MLKSDPRFIFVHYFDDNDESDDDKENKHEDGIPKKYDHLEGSERIYGVPPEDRHRESDWYDSDYHEDVIR